MCDSITSCSASVAKGGNFEEESTRVKCFDVQRGRIFDHKVLHEAVVSMLIVLLYLVSLITMVSCVQLITV